jgi:hypothetical protein
LISFVDYHKWRHKKYGGKIDPDIEKQARITVAKASEVLSAFGIYRNITHGLIPAAYAKKHGMDIEDLDTKLLIYGQAIGIEDKDGKLGKWCVENVERLVEIGIYMKSLVSTKGYVWLQVVEPKSGSRIY